MNPVPPELFEYVDRATPHCLCMGVYLCEPLCRELYTSEALLSAESEADQILSADVARRLRAEIVKRHLLVLRTPSSLKRLDEFVARFYPDAKDPFRATIRREINTLHEGKPRESPIWTKTGQEYINHLIEQRPDDKEFLSDALQELRLPRPPKRNEIYIYQNEDTVSGSLPLLVSTREFVDRYFKQEVRNCLRRGLCIRVLIEISGPAKASADEPICINSELMESTLQSIHQAWDLFKLSYEPEKRLVLRMPNILHYLPLEGRSTDLAFYWAFCHLGRGLSLPPAIGITGSTAPETQQVLPVLGVEEKAIAASECGIHRLCYPLPDSQLERSGIINDPRLFGIDEREPLKFILKAQRGSFPWHTWLARSLDVALIAVLLATWIYLWNWFSIFQDASEGIKPWFSQRIGSGYFFTLTYWAIGVPFRILLWSWPLIVFALVYNTLHPYTECAANYMNFHRWEPGLAPAGIIGDDTSVYKLSRKERITRLAVLSILYWFAWIIGIGAFIPIYQLLESAPKLPDDIGIVTKIIQITFILGCVVLLFGVPTLIYRSAKMVYRRLSRKYPFLV
jgi:hypothetical protein